MFMLLILYHIVMSFVFISHVKKRTLGQAVGLGEGEAYFLICLT